MQNLKCALCSICNQNAKLYFLKGSWKESGAVRPHFSILTFIWTRQSRDFPGRRKRAAARHRAQIKRQVDLNMRQLSHTFGAPRMRRRLRPPSLDEPCVCSLHDLGLPMALPSQARCTRCTFYHRQTNTFSVSSRPAGAPRTRRGALACARCSFCLGASSWPATWAIKIVLPPAHGFSH